MRLAIYRPMSLRRLLLLGVVALATVLWANVALAQYPGGSRNTDEWHMCFTQRTNGGAWSALDCEHLLWYPSTGGGVRPQSQNFEASTSGSASFPTLPNNQEVWTYIVPPAGVMSYTYSCGFQVQRCFGDGISGSSNGTVSTSGPGSSPFDDDDTRFSFGYPTDILANQCFLNNGSVVGRWRASGFDNFSSQEPVAGWTGSPTSNYPSFRAAAGSDSRWRNTLAQYSCRIIDYDMHGSLPIWEPDIGDMVPGPTPTPGPGWTNIPWVPITDTTNMPDIGISPPLTTTCGVVIPEFSMDWSGDTYGWNSVEFCYEEREVGIRYMGFDIGAYILVGLLLGGVGVVVSIMKRA